VSPELQNYRVFRNLDTRAAAQFSENDIVESKPKEDAYKFIKSGRTAKDLFTYRALVEKVVDGDTIKIRFDQGFETSTRQTLRLRAIDCPELGTPAGNAAKAFVQSYVKDASWIIVRSSRSDKYDRYLADVFIPAAGTTNGDSAGEIYLNNLLLEQGHALRAEG
jgi:endonuclease YncB( thermonuclease family)